MNGGAATRRAGLAGPDASAARAVPRGGRLIYSSVRDPRALNAPAAASMDYLPVFLDLRERTCVVVGGGAIAARKIDLLLRAGARVMVVAPQLDAAVAALAETAAISVRQRPFLASDLEGAVFVVAATDDRAVNRHVAASATAAAIPVNAVDQPRDSTAIMPSIVDRSPVVIAIGTGGSAPVLARMLRARIETLIPANYGELAALLGALRERVKAAVPDQSRRRRFWESLLEGPIAELLFVGRRQEALQRIEQALDGARNTTPVRGEVYLIGTGPGDPDLLTFRALRLMQHADVIVYDRLVGDGILDLCRRDADRIYVGKARAQHAVPQDEINALLLQHARAGRRVARLKGGDPFMFGRGGEEIEQLAGAGIDFQVVPGITAALGAAAYGGIPLTHRDVAHSCLFITGHQRDAAFEPNWSSLVQPHQTLVVYMGLASLDRLCRGLIEHGMADTTPAALIERATTAQQRVLSATVATLAATAETAGCGSPATIIIGAVVALRDALAWFERRAPD